MDNFTLSVAAKKRQSMDTKEAPMPNNEKVKQLFNIDVKRELYRKEAMKKHFIAQNAHHPVSIVTSKNWWLLIGLLMIVGSILMWSLLASIHTREVGSGVLVSDPFNLGTLTSDVNGEILELTVDVGEPFYKGDVIARISQPDLIQRKDILSAKLEQQKLLAQSTLQKHDQVIASYRHDADAITSRLKDSLFDLENIITSESDRLHSLKKMNEEKLISSLEVHRQSEKILTLNSENVK